MKKIYTHINRYSRREAIRIVALAGTAASLGLLAFSEQKGLCEVRQSRVRMGTTLNLVVITPDRDQAEAAIAATFSRMKDLETILSHHQEYSELSCLNRFGKLASPSPELFDVLCLAETISRKTDGHFDVTVLPLLDLYSKQGPEVTENPDLITDALQTVNHEHVILGNNEIKFVEPNMAVTLDGIGKGYIVDQGVNTLSGFGFDSVFVEAGGDLLARGGKPSGKPWRIGIRNPRPEMSGHMATVSGDSLAVATSGDYFQPFTRDLSLHHIIDPRSGISPPGLASCTITAPNAALADALATACLVLGTDRSIDLLAGMENCEGYFIGKDLTVCKTNGFNT